MQAFFDALEDYIHFMRVERQVADNTVESYKRDLTDYITYMKALQITTIDQMTKHEIALYLQQMRESGNHLVRCLVLFLRFVRFINLCYVKKLHRMIQPSI